MISRRGIIGVLSGLIAAPSIVKAASLMPVKTALVVPEVSMRMVTDYAAGVDEPIERLDVLFGQMNVRPEWAVHAGGPHPSLNKNNLITIDQITRASVQLFKNSNEFLRNMDRQYDGQFAADGARIGGTLRIRLPLDYVVSDGPKRIEYEYNTLYDGMLPKVVPAPLPQPTLSAPAAVALGAAAVVVANPVVSRRFWK